MDVPSPLFAAPIPATITGLACLGLVGLTRLIRLPELVLLGIYGLGAAVGDVGCSSVGVPGFECEFVLEGGSSREKSSTLRGGGRSTIASRSLKRHDE